MGCKFTAFRDRQRLYSDPVNDVHPNVFSVFNYDDKGRVIEKSEARIEVTEESLVLHQKHHADSFEWPLKSLRRYGAQNHIFSFECGRKCDTGEGIFAFRCFRAEQLLALVQERLRNRAERQAQLQQEHLEQQRRLGQPLRVDLERTEGYLVPNHPPEGARKASTSGSEHRLSREGDSPTSPTAPTSALGTYQNVAVSELTYIKVDFEQQQGEDGEQHPPQTPTSPTAAANATNADDNAPSQYCTIDIDRTKALSTTAQQQTDHRRNGELSPL